MSRRDVGMVIARAVTDEGFLRQLTDRPDEVLGASDLSGSEMVSLRRLKARTLSDFAAKLAIGASTGFK